MPKVVFMHTFLAHRYVCTPSYIPGLYVMASYLEGQRASFKLVTIKWVSDTVQALQGTFFAHVSVEPLWRPSTALKA